SRSPRAPSSRDCGAVASSCARPSSDSPPRHSWPRPRSTDSGPGLARSATARTLDRDLLPSVHMSEADATFAQLDPYTLEQLRRGFPLHMDRQGNFSFEGDPITHPGVVRVFRENLDATENGEVTVGIEGKWVYLKLDDLPLRAVRVDEPLDDESTPVLLLDDGRRMPLDPETLVEQPGGGLCCSVPARGSGRPLG